MPSHNQMTALGALRAARDTKTAADEQFAAAIVAAVNHGLTLRSVADHAGLSHTGVAKIANRAGLHGSTSRRRK